MVTFKTDAFLAQGHDHREIGCQDYALSGVEKQHAYAIVCDGCSGSSFSDIGARLLSGSAKFVTNAIYGVPEPVEGYDDSKLGFPYNNLYRDNIIEGTIRHLSQAFESQKEREEQYDLGSAIITQVPKEQILTVFGSTCLDATLVLAVVTQDTYHGFIWGDGAILVETGDGKILTHVDFPSGCPYYLSYTIDKQRREAYVKELGSDSLKVVTTQQTGLLGEACTIRPILAGDPVYITGPTSNLRNISVMSDGMDSFMNPVNSEKVSHDKVLEQFDFKGFVMNGQFLKRKLNILNRWMKSNHLVHMDDISMSTIHVTP